MSSIVQAEAISAALRNDVAEFRGHPVRWRGRDRQGQPRGGATTCVSPHELARDMYKARWQWAQIMRDGVEVGGVGQIHGQRTWWGEQ